MAEKPLVCVVDDDDLVRQTMCATLVEAGFRVIEAGGGNEGLRQIDSERPAVVVLDIIMPDREGLDIILEVTRRSPETKILAVSGGGRSMAQDYLSMALQLGAHDTLAKPFGRQALAAKVAQLAGISKK